jgi:uncharacterized protein YndB with AHSA1/START domain
MSEDTSVVNQIGSPNDQLKLSANFPQFTPDTLFRYWVEPQLLSKWWSPEAEISPKVGGTYHLAWQSMNLHLRGEYTAFEPGQRLAFTWKWDHEPDLPTREVDISFIAAPHGGTILALTHGHYSDSQADQADRQSHLDGWMHFLSQLHAQTNF